MVRAVLIAAVLSVAFVGAAAATRVGEVSETLTLGPGSAESGNQRSELPRCGGKKTAVAGGFELEFRLGDPAAPVLHPTTFRRDQDGWYLNAINYGPGAGAVTTYAYCAGLDVTSSFFAKRGAGPVLESSAKCRRSGSVALSGGFVLDTGKDVVYAMSRSSKRAWSFAATNPGAGEAGLTAYVVCLDPSAPKLRLRTVRAEAPLAPTLGGATATAVARCPADGRVLSGGFDAPTFADGALVHESRRVGTRAWEVSASSQTPAAGTLVAYAYCV
jgi:hypothetical protein